MTVGMQPSMATINSGITNQCVQLRNVMDNIRQFATYMNAQGSAGLQAIGFSSEDATAALNAVGYLTTIMGCYYGTVQQGGSGGTGASTFNFDNAMSQFWAGQ